MKEAKDTEQAFEGYEPFGKEWKAEIKKANKDFIIAMASKLGKERDGLRIKEDVAYTAKEVAQDHYQRAAKERDELKDYIESLQKSHNELYIKYVSLEQELQALKDAIREYKKAKEEQIKAKVSGKFFEWRDKKVVAWNKVKPMIK